VTQTNRIKTALLYYYTFQRCSKLVCTELWDGFGIADVLALKDKIVTEIEIKISKNDLYNELKKGKETINGLITKHDAISTSIMPVPNKYYFCIPTELVDEAISFSNKLNPKYGIIEFSNTIIKKCIKIRKKAHMIHTKDNSINYERRMLERIPNDLVNKYMKLYWK
jgi:hypothetical protein